MEKKPDESQAKKESVQPPSNPDQKKEESNDSLKDEENFLFHLIKKSILEEKEKEKEPDKNPLNKLSNNESGLLSSSIKKLQTGDDMDIMNELILLCEQLSLSSDQIGDNPNMPKLLEEVSKNYEKL